MSRYFSGLLYFPGFRPSVQRLGAVLGCQCQEIAIHHFPDGESLVRLPAALEGRVIIYTSLNQPDEKLVPLGFAAAAARELGASSVILVAPYLCYMRQDKAFQPGEAVSQRIVGSWLDDWFDMVITVDAHLHRIREITDVISCGVNITAASFMAAYLRELSTKPVLLGPDEESLQWVKKIAKGADLEYGIASKVRRGDHDVEINLPEVDVRGRDVMIVDDVLSSGHTVAEAARLVRDQGAAHISCMVTHALFAPGAEILVRESGVERIISSDTIIHPSNRIFMAEGLADALNRAVEEGRV